MRIAIAVFALAGCVLTAVSSASEGLAARFADPPHEHSLVAFWSWNGTLEPDQLRWQIDQFVEQGVYGAFMHARAGIESGGTPYFSDGWWDAVSVCIDHGREVGFRLWIYDEDKWPSGLAGGRTIERNPQRNPQQALRIVERVIEGPARVPLDAPGASYAAAAREHEPGVLDPETMTGLTGHLGGTWECPPGTWRVFQYVLEPYGHAIDYLNPATVRDFIDITHEAYAKRYREHFGTSVPGVFFDEIMNDAGKSPEHIVWTGAFADRFEALKGYALPPLLPALTHDVGPMTPKIRCDYYDVYTTLYEAAWFAQIADWCADHGIELTGHTVEDLNRYITQGDYMRTQRHLQIPLTDNEDFRYTWPRTIGPWKPKQIASVGHLYDKPRVGVEALGGAGWTFTLESARYGFNMLAAYGVTFFVPHLFHYAQDTPAQVGDWPNSWFFRNPYWKYFKNLADHCRRVSYVLYDGEPAVDVAILYPQANQWAGYGPGTTEAALSALVAAPIDADIIDPNSLMQARVHQGALHAGRAAYRVLIVPALTCLRRAEADAILRFADSGGHVIVHERWPTDSMEMGRDDPHMTHFREALEALGVTPTPLEDTAARVAAAVPLDMVVESGPEGALRHYHVRKDGLDIYWIVNGQRVPGLWTLSLRATGSVSRWDPETGQIHALDAETRNGRPRLTLALDGGQGQFVVIDPDGPAPAAPEAPPVLQTRIPVADWTLLPVGSALDHAWHTDVAESVLAVPVMQVRWEGGVDPAKPAWAHPDYDAARWRSIKVWDALHPEKGADRYRSRWTASFITYYPYTEFDIDQFFAPQFGGDGLAVRTELLLPPEAGEGWLAVACAGPYKVLVNGVEMGRGPGGKTPQRIALTGLRPGHATLTIETQSAEFLMAEGQILPAYGPPIPLYTDGTWDARIAGTDWASAWVYGTPPDRPPGEPAHPELTGDPTVVWYRQVLPPGAHTIDPPHVQGRWTLWVDGAPIAQSGVDDPIALPADARVAALRVALDGSEKGLITPLEVQCRPAARPLSSWTDHGLAWYSGRVLYAADLTLDANTGAAPAWLDLGKAAYCAEIWINGHLAGTRVWPPYRVAVTGLLKPGVNRVEIVVASLLANRMAWDIFDDTKPNQTLRRWHKENIQRDAWALQSGLIGPVALEVYAPADDR